MSSIDRLQDLIRSRVRADLLQTVAPPFVGDWSDDPADLIAEHLARLAITLSKQDFDQPWPVSHKALAARSTPLRCFPGGFYHEVVLEDRAGTIGQVGYLSQGQTLAGLSTRSEEVYSAVEALAFEVSDPEAAADYFRLFCWSICGETGPFQIIETREQLPQALRGHVRATTLSGLEPALSGPDKQVEVPEALNDLSAEELDDITPKLWRITATLIHGGQLFDADLLLMPGARVKMVKDHPVDDAIDKSHSWRLERFLRFLEPAQ